MLVINRSLGWQFQAQSEQEKHDLERLRRIFSHRRSDEKTPLSVQLAEEEEVDAEAELVALDAADSQDLKEMDADGESRREVNDRDQT